jgi:hypothetical protein
MRTPEVDTTFLTIEQAMEIKDEGERVFALSCIAVGCNLQHQISVGDSIIDFLVVNPKKPPHLENKGTLVEVTLMPKEDIDKRTLLRKIKGKKRRVINKTGFRKKRQEKSMTESDYQWTMLYRENILNLLQIRIDQG